MRTLRGQSQPLIFRENGAASDVAAPRWPGPACNESNPNMESPSRSLVSSVLAVDHTIMGVCSAAPVTKARMGGWFSIFALLDAHCDISLLSTSEPITIVSRLQGKSHRTTRFLTWSLETLSSAQVNDAGASASSVFISACPVQGRDQQPLTWSIYGVSDRKC